MFRQTPLSICVRITFVFAIVVRSSVSAQNETRPEQQSEEIRQLLTDWFTAGSNIEKLSGSFERHVYDNTFQIEKIAIGEFWYEASDKGRLDVLPVKITPDMIQARERPKVRVRRGKDGMPFSLRSDRAEQWICDGIQVYDIDDEAKEAQVVPLQQLEDSRDFLRSRYWFFFGLPPDQAVERFRTEIVKDYRPEHELVRLKTMPLRPAADLGSVQIILDTQKFLPTAVQLNDPSGTSQIVYKFKDLEINGAEWSGSMLGRDPFDPNLEGFKVSTVQGSN